MAGVLFIVIVPRTEHEKELRKRETRPKVIIEGEKYENNSKMIEELKVNKKFGSIKSSIESYAQDDSSVVLSKCKSTECLHPIGKEIGLQKSNSELILGDNKKSTLGIEYKKYVKTSWDEFKQTIKPRKQKLKISSKQKKADILATFHYETPLETILSDVLRRLQIHTAAWSLNKADNFWQVVFSLESGNLCEEALQVLKTFGIGSSSWSRFASSVRARTNLAQVLHDVRSDAALTFDWLFLLIVAAFVAAIGLVENSTVILVASMLISPLMGPITAGTLGTMLKDRSLQRIGLQHELLGLFLSLVIGFVFGLAICAVDEHYGIGDWPTNEMMSRCEIRSLWVGVLIAIPSGAGVALAVLGEYTASLVGVAISASLLPPAVNAGLLWAMSLVHLVFMDDDTRWTGVVKTTIYSSNQAVELAVLGAVSLCLTLVNIICIFVAGVVVYKVKEVSPMEPRDLSWWKAGRESRRNITSNLRRNEEITTWDFYRWCQTSEHLKSDVCNSEIGGNNRETTPCCSNSGIPAMFRKTSSRDVETYCQPAQLHTDCISHSASSYGQTDSLASKPMLHLGSSNDSAKSSESLKKSKIIDNCTAMIAPMDITIDKDEIDKPNSSIGKRFDSLDVNGQIDLNVEPTNMISKSMFTPDSLERDVNINNVINGYEYDRQLFYANNSNADINYEFDNDPEPIIPRLQNITYNV